MPPDLVTLNDVSSTDRWVYLARICDVAFQRKENSAYTTICVCCEETTMGKQLKNATFAFRNKATELSVVP